MCQSSIHITSTTSSVVSTNFLQTDHTTAASHNDGRLGVLRICIALELVYGIFFFFFQAEDGIRDLTVTGVQTCALPICTGDRRRITEMDIPRPAWFAPHAGDQPAVGREGQPMDRRCSAGGDVRPQRA